MSSRFLPPLALLFSLASLASAGDWTNNGGNAARNGLSDEVGPLAADPLWNGGRNSIIAWQPMIAGRRVFSVRQTGFPPAGEPNGSPVVCQDLDTGAELWFRHVPYVAGDWTTFLLGTSNGRLYAGRSGNGASVSQIFYALDQATGNTVWTSDEPIDAGPYDGICFATNGDIVVGNAASVRRVSALDGSTVWETPRLCNVTSSCGIALFGDAVYVAEPAPGGNWIKKLDLASGAVLYNTVVMAGFTSQNTPFVGPDATVYLSRTQNNPAVDRFYAFSDTGSALNLRWDVEAGWSTTSEFGCAPDGTVYMLDRDLKIRAYDSSTGDHLFTTANAIGTSFLAPHFAVDRSGKIFVSNGGFSDGRLYAFNPDLTQRWSVGVTNINQGGPALGEDGTLVVTGVGSNIRAYRSSCQTPATATVRNAFLNPVSLSSSLPILGSTWTATVDLTETGHTSAILVARTTPTAIPLGGGQAILCGGTRLYSASAGGPEAVFTNAIPNDLALCGFTLCVQAAHLGGVVPFALSNALDLVVGG
ncbi:MAG: PQQ-binding-like beta-propeller repeat protein [Planctomycetota bacterium]